MEVRFGSAEVIIKPLQGVLGVNFIFAKQVQMLGSNTEFDDLETKNLE